MSDSGDTPEASSPLGEEKSPSPPPPDDGDDGSSSSSSSSPPPDSNSPPPPNSNSESSTPSPPPDSDSSPPSPPSSSDPPKSSPPPPPSHSNSSTPSPQNPSPSPPPPSSPASPVALTPPASETPPSSETSTPPAPPTESLPAPAPSNGSNPSPGSGSSGPSPPTQTISPPLPVSPPVAVSSPNLHGTPPETSNPNPTPPTELTPSTPSTSTPLLPPPPPPRTSHRAPSSNTPSSANSTTDASTSKQSVNSGSGTVVGATVAGVLVIALVLFCVVSRRRKRRAEAYTTHYMPPNSFSVKSDGYYYGQQQHTMGGSVQTDSYYGSQPPHSSSYGSQRGNMFHGGGPESGVMGGAKSWFSYEELMEVTNGFAHQNVLGEGGFGCVYKGWLPDGRVVAVKQLKAGSGQGEREFRAEVEIISRVHHRHLVSLVGYCIAENQRLLIYEFLPNKTLEHHLHGTPALDWAQRLRIALGAARGLAYLHEDCHPKIIHRDIKSANILLDDAFEAQVADFGLAKLTNDTYTHVSTRVMGTFGYMAPEYASSGKLTDRSDVFSFGVVLLELVTGRKPVDPNQPLGDESLVEWARPLLIHALESGDFGELVDPRLENHYVQIEMFRMIEAAAACVRHSAPKRPRMVQVVRALDSEGEMSDLTNGVKFGQSTIYDSGQYNQDIKRFRRTALGSEDSSEYNTNSGEYTSREVSGPPSSWKSKNSSSGFQSDESETRAINARSGEQRTGTAQGNYGGRRFNQM